MKGAGGGIRETALGREQQGKAVKAPIGLVVVVHKEAKRHDRGSGGKGNVGREAWSKAREVSSETGRKLGPSHRHGKGTVELLVKKELVRTRREGQR